MIPTDDDWADRADAAVDQAKEAEMGIDQTMGDVVQHKFMGDSVDIEYVCGSEPGRWAPLRAKQKARVFTMGCGFAFQVVVVAFDGECIWTFTQTGGHAVNVAITQALADTQIEVASATRADEEQRRAIADKFLSWLPPGLREDQRIVDLVLT